MGSLILLNHEVDGFTFCSCSSQRELHHWRKRCICRLRALHSLPPERRISFLRCHNRQLQIWSIRRSLPTNTQQRHCRSWSSQYQAKRILSAEKELVKFRQSSKLQLTNNG